MSDFKAKMHQIRFRLGLPQTPLESLQRAAPPDSLAGFEGLLLREGREKVRGERGGQGGEGRREEAFLVMWTRRLSALNPPLSIQRAAKTYIMRCLPASVVHLATDTDSVVSRRESLSVFASNMTTIYAYNA